MPINLTSLNVALGFKFKISQELNVTLENQSFPSHHPKHSQK